MIFTEQGLIQELLRVQKTIYDEPSNSGNFPGDSGNIPNDPIQKEIDEITRAIKDLDKEDKKKELQGLRSSYASRLYSLWQQLPLDRKERMNTFQDAEHECGVENSSEDNDKQ